MTTLQRSIIQTLAYFDIFHYPLTLVELHRYLWQAPPLVTLPDVYSTVQQLSVVEYHNGLACLQGRAKIIEQRTAAYLESERKYKKRLPYIRLLSYLPHVQAIFVVNSLAFQNVHPNSDIDLLIVTQPGKIWSTRFFTTVVAKLLRLRPRPGFTKDTLCLSFYVDGAGLNLEHLMGSTEDVHEVYWLRHLFPVYDPNNTAQQIAKANRWVQHYLPYARPVRLHPLRTIRHTWLHSLTQTVLGIVSFERMWKKVQLAVLPAKLKQLSGPANLAVVVLSDQLLKFHTHDPKPAWQRQWQAIYSRYGARNSISSPEAAT